nr:ODV-E56 [Pieris rapae granulovirus]
MASLFSGLRRTNKVYPNVNSFAIDHSTFIRNKSPPGFNLNNPSTLTGPNGQVIPGYTINNRFVSNADVNSVLRNNDVLGMRDIFPNVTNNQMNGLTNLRRADNIPDSSLNSLQTKKNNVKKSFPETTVRDRDGVEYVLKKNPRLSTYLKSAGYVTLVGAGVYLIINVADLVGSIVDAINRTGGSWYYRGHNGADNFDNITACVLRYRSCGMKFEDIEESLCVLDPHDPNNVDPLMSIEEARVFCNGYSYVREKSVCRGSDTKADPTSLQYLDISNLATNQTIQCVEPYDFGDLIGDLGLDWLLGDDSVFAASSNSIGSFSNNFFTILLLIGGVILLVFIGFIVYKVVTTKRLTT